MESFIHMSIKIESTNKHLSSLGGLFLADELIKKLQLIDLVRAHLPELKIANDNMAEKFKNLTLGFIAGAECLDDMDRLNSDGVFENICDTTFTARSYGDFLRLFKNVHIRELQNRLIDQSLSLRQTTIGETKDITIDIDSTVNEQHGKKMEGVKTNHKGILCLDTIKAFDEYGFQYWHFVRPGATYTSENSAEIISAVFNRISKHATFSNLKRYARADSGMCNADFFNACFVANAKFVTCFKENMLQPIEHTITRWHSFDKDDPKRIKFYDGRECEYGETVYQGENCLQTLRVVVIRAEQTNGPLITEPVYDYYAWVTNIGSEEWSVEEVIRFYRKRGNAENFIRESKYGFDLKHYPCLKLTANKAYGIIGAFAYNLMRYFALLDNSKKPHFSKLTRYRLIYLPVQIIRHAGKVVFKFMKHHFTEVKGTLEKITSQQFVIANLGPPKTAVTDRSLKT